MRTTKQSFIKPAPDNLVEIVWGGHFIEKMKGLPLSGKTIGESWECSAHPQHPSIVTTRDGAKLPLPELLSQNREKILGKEMSQEFDSLPILVKFIDAREDLSVQVHPSDEKAKELGENDSGKEEAWVILQADPDAVLYLGFKKDVDKKQFAQDLANPKVNIAQKYLNAIPVHEGCIFFNPAQTIHAIGKGVVLAEIQQSSGITYRVWDWNRIPKRPMHIEQALQVLNFNKQCKEDFLCIPRRISEKEERLIDSLHFSVDRVSLGANERLTVTTTGGFHVLCCTEGDVHLKSKTSSEYLSRGQCLLVPADIDHYELQGINDAIVLRSYVSTVNHIDPVIFQTYDVRAIADNYLSDRTVYYLGKGYGTFLRRTNGESSPHVKSSAIAASDSLWAVVGGGVRLSTERIRRSLIKGILSAGVNVYDARKTSTPELYFAIPYLEADGGVNITASHNEAEYNGLKQVLKSHDGFITSINADQMLELKEMILKGDFLEGHGQYIQLAEDIIAIQHNNLVQANCRLGRKIWVHLMDGWKEKGLKALLDALSDIEFPAKPNERVWKNIRSKLGIPAQYSQPSTAIKHPLHGLRVVIDFGNGSAWRTGEIFTNLGAEIVSLNGDPDGSFPSHMPDPIKAKYRKQLEDAVRNEANVSDKEIVGVGYDEDADRVIYVRSDGQVVEGDRTLAIQAKAIIEDYKSTGGKGKPRFMGEVKFSRIAEEFVTENGGEYIMSPTGFAFIKEGAKMLCRNIREGLPEAIVFGNKIDLRDNKEPIVLAAELSGHQMAGHEENWIFDDAALATTKLLSIIANGMKNGKTFIELDKEVPRYPATPELNIRLQTNVISEKEEIVSKVVETFHNKGYAINTTDGGLIKWVDGDGKWLGQALVRKSNTQPMVICRVEGRDEEAKGAIEDEFFAKSNSCRFPQLLYPS